MPKPAKLGTFWNVHATLFDKNGKRVARCSDTPNAIAKGFIENPDATLVKTINGGYVDRSEYNSRIEMLKTHGEHFNL